VRNRVCENGNVVKATYGFIKVRKFIISIFHKKKKARRLTPRVSYAVRFEKYFFTVSVTGSGRCSGNYFYVVQLVRIRQHPKIFSYYARDRPFVRGGPYRNVDGVVDRCLNDLRFFRFSYDSS